MTERDDLIAEVHEQLEDRRIMLQVLAGELPRLRVDRRRKGHRTHKDELRALDRLLAEKGDSAHG